MNESGVPSRLSGLPHALTIAQAAEVLALNPNRVRGWVDRDKVDVVQLDRHMARLIPLPEVLRMAERLQVTLDWDRLADFL